MVEKMGRNMLALVVTVLSSLAILASRPIIDYYYSVYAQSPGDTTVPITVSIPINIQAQNAQICASILSSGSQTCQQLTTQEMTVSLPINIQAQNAQLCISIASSGSQTCQQIVISPSQTTYQPVNVDQRTNQYLQLLHLNYNNNLYSNHNKQDHSIVCQ